MSLPEDLTNARKCSWNPKLFVCTPLIHREMKPAGRLDPRALRASETDFSPESQKPFQVSLIKEIPLGKFK